MPYFDSAGKLTMYQVRNFSTYEKPKYLTFGPKADIMHLVGQSKSDTVIVTEDLISAIKVGRTFQAFPLWGADMALGLIQQVAKRFASLGIWLDHDKGRDAVRIALRASQYIPTFVVDTQQDPKNYSDVTISEYIKAAESTNKLYKEEDMRPKFTPNPSIEETKAFLASVDEHIADSRKKIVGPDGFPVDQYLAKHATPESYTDINADDIQQARNKGAQIEATSHEFLYGKSTGGSWQETKTML